MTKKSLVATLLFSSALVAAGLTLAQESITPLPSKSPRSELKVKPKTDPVCMQTAIEKRDVAMIAGTDAYSMAIKSALNTRKETLKNAWLILETKERRTALKNAWKDFKLTAEKARKDFKTAKRTAWDQFFKDRKACGPSAVSDDNTSSGVDNNL